MKSMKRAAGVALVVALAALAGMEWLSWRYTAPTPVSPECQVVLERFALKSEVIDHLRGGELTLIQAAARFRDIEADPRLATGFEAGEPADGEALCRQIIDWAQAQEEEAKAP